MNGQIALDVNILYMRYLYPYYILQLYYYKEKKGILNGRTASLHLLRTQRRLERRTTLKYMSGKYKLMVLKRSQYKLLPVFQPIST